jgi:hypothetical protein
LFFRRPAARPLCRRLGRCFRSAGGAVKGFESFRLVEGYEQAAADLFCPDRPGQDVPMDDLPGDADHFARL